MSGFIHRALSADEWYNAHMSPLTKKTLFWDTDVTSINPVLHKRYIIERILRFGNLTDYSWLKNVYSEKEIKGVIQRERSELDRRSMNFWRFIYKIGN